MHIFWVEGLPSGEEYLPGSLPVISNDFIDADLPVIRALAGVEFFHHPDGFFKCTYRFSVTVSIGMLWGDTLDFDTLMPSDSVHHGHCPSYFLCGVFNASSCGDDRGKGGCKEFSFLTVQRVQVRIR